MASQASSRSGAGALNPSPIEVVACYSHNDEILHDELAKHLKPLEREGVILRWHDRRIAAGKEFEAEIDVSLNRAGIILLLVSPDFIASEYCWGKEMKRAMERHDSGGARVIPIILRAVDWHKTPFGKLLALPKDGKPVTSWANQDDALLDVAKGIRAVAADLGIAAEHSPALAVEVREVAFTTQYRGVIIEVDIGNRSPNAHQITRCSLEIPSLGITLEHSPGPFNMGGGARWLPHVPISLEPRRLSRGNLFFSAGMGPLREGPSSEPLPAKLRLEFFLESAIQQEIEIYTFDALRRIGQERMTTASGEVPHDTGIQTLSPAEKLRAVAERRRKETAEKQAEQERREALERAAMDAGSKEFERLAELLRTCGESLNAEHLPGVPILRFEPVNHRLDAGYTYSIELSPYAEIRAFTAIVRVGLHPSAHLAHAELPNVETISWHFRAQVDKRGFSWLDQQGDKWSSERIIDVAIGKLTDLLSADPKFPGELKDSLY